MLDKWLFGTGLDYSDFAWKAASQNKVFENFRRHRAYTRILEHVTVEQGAQFLALVTDPVVRKICLDSEAADRIGNPRRGTYEGRELSPTTLRYGKVASDILTLFPRFREMKTICEIGVGYGGQARILSEYAAAVDGALVRYELVDLPEVLLLAEKYLLFFYFPNEMVTRSKGAIALKGTSYDLAISNFAFSEFDRPLQQEYLEKILMNAKSGYLTMNSGGAVEPGKPVRDVYSQAELLRLLPNAKILDEVPLTSKNNYILVYGDHVA